MQRAPGTEHEEQAKHLTAYQLRSEILDGIRYWRRTGMLTPTRKKDQLRWGRMNNMEGTGLDAPQK